MTFKKGDRVAVNARDPNLNAHGVAGKVDVAVDNYLFITLDDKRAICVNAWEATLLMDGSSKPANGKRKP
jgi:hypothetical protein